MTKILCLDFDGVLHSYKSGWKGPRTIPDPPVPGALEFLSAAVERFEVHIYSSRSRFFMGRRAMKRWLLKHLILLGHLDLAHDHWWLRKIAATHHMEPWDHEVERAARELVGALHWPLHKPPAHLTLDDRAVTFTGSFPSLQDIDGFRPWHTHNNNGRKPTTQD